MADSKKRKQVKRAQNPRSQPKAQWSPNPAIAQGGNPNDVMRRKPVWKFSSCDTGTDCEWAFHKDRLLHDFWNVIFPKLREYENMTWADIQVSAKKQNHYINTDSLNKIARDRLASLQIEAEDIFSLRLGGKLRLYGLIIDGVYHILWYDNNHGDNETCVCRSRLKHT